MKQICLFLTAIFLCSAKCKKDTDDCHFTMTYSNNAAKTIYFQELNEYPDTLLRQGFTNPFSNPEGFRVRPFATYGYKRNICMEARYKHYIPSDTMMIYLFDEEVLKSNDFEVVKANNMYLQRYDLSLEDLRKLNYNIPYPATTAMKDMKMWPKYVP